MNNDNANIFLNSNGLLVSTLVAGLMAFSGTASAAATQQTADRDQQTIVNPENANEEVDYTLQQKVEDEEGELLATQPGKVSIDEEVETDTEEEIEADDQPINNREARATANQIQVTPAIVTEPKLAGEAGGDIESTPITLQQKVKDKRGELEATQPGQVEVQESRSIRAQ